MSTATFRKHDERDDLLALGADVHTSAPATARPILTAREAARALVGVIGWVSHRSSTLEMQDLLAQLVRHDPAWEPGAMFRALPLRYDGRVDELMALVASVASGLVPLFGVGPLRAAMAFWATETDPAIWQTVAAA